jgi:hypothetical protein
MVGRMARRLWPLLAVGALLAGVGALSLFSHPGFHSLPVPPSVRHRLADPTPTVQITVRTTDRGSSGGDHSFTLLALIVGWLFAAVVVAVAGFVIWYFVKSWLQSSSARRSSIRAGELPTLTRREAVLAAVDAGIVELARADGDPRAAIIACWVRLEEVAEAAGTARSPGDTSSDLVARLLGDHQVSQSVLTSLATLYRTARYSTAPIESSMRDEALSAFEHLRVELMQSRSGPLADVPMQSADDPEFTLVRAGAPDDDRRPSPRRERR